MRGEPAHLVGSHLILPESQLGEMKIFHRNTRKWAIPARWDRVFFSFFNQIIKLLYFIMLMLVANKKVCDHEWWIINYEVPSMQIIKRILLPRIIGGPK